MRVLHLNLWGEPTPLDEVFDALNRGGMTDPVTDEIARQWIMKQAIAEHGLTNSPEQLAQYVGQVRQQMKLQDDAKYQMWLRKEKTTREVFERKIASQLLIARLKKTVITPLAVEEQFVTRKGQLETVLFGMIEVPEKKHAEFILQELIEHKKDFCLQAMQFSKHVSAEKGGLMGPMPISTLGPLLRNNLLSMEPGQTSQLVEDGRGNYLILRLYAHNKASLTREVEEQCRDQLFNEWLRRQMKLAGFQLLDTLPVNAA